MSLVKLASINWQGTKKFWKTGVPLIAGIGAADAVVEGVTAKPGERGKEALKGLGKGILYGSVLHGVEHKMDLSEAFKRWKNV